MKSLDESEQDLEILKEKYFRIQEEIEQSKFQIFTLGKQITRLIEDGLEPEQVANMQLTRTGLQINVKDMENTLETLTARMEDIQAQIDDLAQEGSNEIYNQLCDERETFELEIETMVDDLELKLNGYIELSQRQDTHVHGAKVGVDRKIHAKTKMLLENYLAHRFKPFIESSARPSFKTGLFEAGAALRVKR